MFYSEGTWAWRDNNPGNLVPGKVSARHNQIGSTGKFAIFPDYANGHLALLDCLKTTYKNASIDNLIRAFAPAKDGNNVKVYRKFLHDRTGVKDDKKVKDFTAGEFDKFWRAIEAMEGYKEGVITKATILHQYAHLPQEKELPPRISRHYYDFFCLLNSVIKSEALSETNLLDRVATHKSIYFASSWANYATASKGSLKLSPPMTLQKTLEKDYLLMRDMFFGDVPEWMAILKIIKDFEDKFNKT